MYSQFLEFYNTLPAEWGMLVMLMLMSIGVALFHTVIFAMLYEIEVKPKWLFFLLNPALIGFSALADKKMGVLVAIILFLSVFVLGVVGMVVAGIRDGIESGKNIDGQLKRQGKKGLPWWKKLLYAVSGLAFFGLILSLGVPYFILIVFIILPFLSSLKSDNKKRFYRFQRTLPTATIRSVAMGLAEISGRAKGVEPIISRIKKKECIGYLYTVENVSTDDEGRDSYSLISSETVCKPFFVEDATGRMKILPDDIEFIDFEIDEQYQSSMKRYTQYLLTENMEVLLIGKAGISEHNEAVFQHEEVKNVFGIAPVESVVQYNHLRPLLVSAGYFIYFWVILIALILLTPIRFTKNSLEVGKIEFGTPFQKLESVKSVTDFYDKLYESYDNNEEENANTTEAEFAEPATAKDTADYYQPNLK